MGVTYIAPAGTVTSPAKLITKNITDNGTYDAADDLVNGYSQVTVNVEGGGGGDFSTAEVTITNIEEYTSGTFNGVNIYEGEMVRDYLFGDDTAVVNAVLYKGSATASIDCEEITGYTGNITVDGYDLTITGDCTLTVKGYGMG